MTRKVLTALSALVLAAALITIPSGVESSDAATAARGRLKMIRKHEDRFRNYDFSDFRVSRRKVDWPVNFLFYGNADIDKVKEAMSDFLWFWGSTMHGRVNDGLGMAWDDDGGIKNVVCSEPIAQGSTGYHMRLYASPSYNYMYNRTWGYYVLGTSHIDFNECYDDRWFGRSETVEGVILRHAREVYGADRVKSDHRDFKNDEKLRREGNHIWKNNGLATFIRVP